MKRIFILITLLVTLTNCKMVMKSAAKYWTRKQIKEFVGKCEDHASKIMSDEKAVLYCDCAVDVVAEKYNSFEDAMKAGLIEVLKTAKDCK
jgi:hypothetical protein